MNDVMPFDHHLLSGSDPEFARKPDIEAQSLSDVFVNALCSLGVEHAFGLLGGAGLKIYDALMRSPIGVVHCRHEAGAAFAATEAYFASGRAAIVFTTTGPGITNALTGLAAAKRDGAQVILVSAATAGGRKGRWAFQETSSETMHGTGLLEASGFFDYATCVHDPEELENVLLRLTAGLARPGGFVAHVSIPPAVQARPARAQMADTHLRFPAAAARDTVATVTDLIAGETLALWVGHGARNASAEVRAFAEASGAAVMCSPRGKGIFPASHRQFIGVTGYGGHMRVHDYLARNRPAWTLVLGTRLGEFTSFWSDDYVPTRGFVHVDIDETIPGRAYPRVPTVGVQSDVGAFLAALTPRLEAANRRAQTWPTPIRTTAEPLGDRRPVRTSRLMQGIQSVIVENSDAMVMTEAGNAFTWGTHALRFEQPNRYRVSVGFGSMGHATTGVVGAAIARRAKAVAVVGDGAMLMNSEVSTAVRYQTPAVWIVLNDSRFGLVVDGMRDLGFENGELDIPDTDFVAIARAMGADGIRVDNEAHIEAALRRAMTAPGPFVVDVITDPREKAPLQTRVASLLAQARGSK